MPHRCLSTYSGDSVVTFAHLTFHADKPGHTGVVVCSVMHAMLVIEHWKMVTLRSLLHTLYFPLACMKHRTGAFLCHACNYGE